MRVIIFTDLDGSLLNHHDYSFAEARPSLARIKRAGIPLVMTTSKTRREVELLQREMGLREPFIVENGGGIFFPAGYGIPPIEGENVIRRDGYVVVSIGTTYERVRAFVKQSGGRFGMRGFGDMTASEIAGLTGLPLERAALAREREFTEPFLVDLPDDIDPVREAAAREGLNVTRGGRFFHLIGIGQDKGKAVRMAQEIISRGSKAATTSIGLGDSENDLAMLEAVDIPVLIPRPGKGYLDIRLPGLIKAGQTGAAGWNDAVQRLLDERMSAAAGRRPAAAAKGLPPAKRPGAARPLPFPRTRHKEEA